MPAPAKILDLIGLYRENTQDCRAATFNGANLRQQFVNPMFKALGWDMENEAGHAEAYKDAIHEDAQRFRRCQTHSVRIRTYAI